MAEYEVIIIGGGTSGLKAAIISANTGYNTLLIEPNDLGGTCLNTGCIPTKTLLHAAEVYNLIKESGELGIKAKPKFDYDKVVGRAKSIVKRGRKGAENSVEKNQNLTLLKGHARFKDKRTVRVGEEEFSANKMLIATGTRNWVPEITGLKETGYYDHTNILDAKQPKSIILIGGGYISCEFACFFASFGIPVMILEKKERILPYLEKEVTDVAHAALEELGVKIFTNVDIKEVNGKNGKRVEVVADRTYEAQCLLVSTGRRANTDDMKLDKADVKTDEHGFIKVNAHMQTSNDNIYAVGDVNGTSLFAHTAKKEAKVALENALLKGKAKINHNLIPWAVFTFPSIAGVGLTEEEAKKKHKKVGIMKADFAKLGKAKILRQETGFVKVVFDQQSREILGAAIIGPDAHNLIHEFAALLNMPQHKIDDFLETVHTHPTLSEIMDSLREVD
ncbi:dihydrolipoyl dehydrogenase [Nanoarchaeota archaeon]